MVKCYQCNSKTFNEEDCASSDENSLKKFIKVKIILTIININIYFFLGMSIT